MGLPKAADLVKTFNTYIDQTVKAEDEAANRIATKWWNSNVEPAKQLCLKQGGIPKFVDIPNTGRYDWQVECQYPPPGVIPCTNTQASSK